MALAVLACAVAAPAHADRDDRGHARGRYVERVDHRGWDGPPGRGWKEEYWDGRCMVERKFDRRGGYKEERRCPGRGHGRHDGFGYGGGHGPGAAYGPGVAYGPAPVYGYPAPVYRPAPVHRPGPVYGAPAPGVYVQPPAVVIQPPGFVIR